MLLPPSVVCHHPTLHTDRHQQVYVTQLVGKRVYSRTEIVLLLLLTLAILECIYETVDLLGSNLKLLKSLGLGTTVGTGAFVASLYVIAIIGVLKRSSWLMLVYVAFDILVSLPSIIMFFDMMSNDGHHGSRPDPMFAVGLMIGAVMLFLACHLAIEYRRPLPVLTTMSVV